MKLLLWITVGHFPTDTLLGLWRPWWLASAISQLFIGGALFAWQSGGYSRPKFSWRFRWELTCLFIAVALVAGFNYTTLASHNNLIFARPFMLFPLMIWAALRFDLLGVTGVGIIVMVSWILGASQGFVPATSLPQAGGQIQQFLLIAVGAIGFVLAAAVREKQEAIDARNEFISIASHELRTPVTSVSLQIQLFQKQLLALPLRSKEEERWLESFRRAGRHITRLSRLVDQLLDVSRIERRDLSLRYEAVDLATLIDEIIARMQSDLAQSRCTVELALTRGISGRWDPIRIEQVLENLLTNAMKYAPGAPIRIATALVEGNFAEIDFSDRGPGIPESKRAKIFERFFRAGAEDNGVGGMGLGLFISREIIRAHQGSITVESSPGGGTQFRIRLPLSSETESRS